MNPNLRKALAGGALAATIIGTGGYAFAQTTTDPTASSGTTQTAPADAPADAPAGAPDGARRGPRGGENREQRAADLAERLGLSADQVTAAQDAARASVDAQLGTPQKPTEKPTSPPTDEERAAHEAEHQARHEAFEQAFASELGISVEQLQAAHEAIAEEHLAEKVAAGEITQEQADEMLAHIQSGDVGPHGPGGPGGHGMGRPVGPPPADGSAPADAAPAAN